MQKKWLQLLALAGLMGGNVLCAGAEEWPQVFADDFNRTDILGGDWVIQSGKWDIRGELKAIGPGAVLMCTRRFQVPFRIEYECSSDNPCDLSLQFNGSLDKQVICYAGFGSEHNTKNKITTPNDGDVAVSKENLIEPGRRHRVVVEATETNIRQVIDGKESVKAAVKMPKKAVYFGLTIWNSGAISSVKVFSPNAATSGEKGTVSAKISTENPAREFRSFEDWPAGAIAGTNCVVNCGKKCSVKIADMPTWLYYNVKSESRGYMENEDPAKADTMMKMLTNNGCHFVSDHSIELVSENTGGKEKAAISFPVPAMQTGLVEFEVLADQYTGDALRVRLGDKLGLLIDKDGTFYWEAGGKTVKLADNISYPAMGGSTRFYLQPQRWFMVRIDYDIPMSLANVTILGITSRESVPTMQYLPIGEDLPLPTDKVSTVTFETAGAGRFFIDNLFFINRTSDLADDAKWRVSARKIMKAYYHLRKDPLNLKTWSLRNVRNMMGSGSPAGDELGDLLSKPGQYPVIMESAKQYNRILIEQAFLAEKMRGLERAYYYLGVKPDNQAGKYGEQMTQVRKSAAETEVLLTQLYRFYADCYLDGLNQAKMKEGFAPRAEALKSAIAKSDAMIQSAYGDMISKVSGKAGPIACQYERRTETEPLTYSEGSHRRNGNREFVFVKTQLMWPYMDKELLFPDIITEAIDHLISKVKEPEYCNPSTNTWFFTVLNRNTNDLLGFKVWVGIHGYDSGLPAWWIEKHKDDPDIYLRNYKGEITLPADDCWKPFNLWNPEVLAAQKAMFGGAMDVIAGYKREWSKRLVYIDMTGESWFQIPAPGGLWETGYNKTAIQAFREYLKKTYGTIEALNAKWDSQYADFAAIQPPEDFRLKPRLVPAGLTYEFERFRQKSWFDWMKQCHGWMQEKLPQKVPSACDFSYPFLSCQDAIDGFDSVRMFETFNIVMEHYQLRFAQDHGVYRYLENLRQVFKTNTGIGEWYVSGDGDLFDEQGTLNNGLRQAYQHAQWGRNVLTYWGGHDFMFMESSNWTEGRLGHTVFRYFASYIPLSIARARAHQAIYLECPLVEPDVGIIESETSFYNVMNVRGGLNEFSGLLFSKGYDFGYLFERLIMDGRQKLDNYKVLILPNALSLPADFTQKILAWVEKGGTLIATGPVGVWNEYGQTNGLILDKVIGQGNWTCESRIFKLKDKLTDTETLKVVYRKDASFLLEGKHGQGKVIIRQGSLPAEMIYVLISTNAPRVFYGECNKFHLVMRQGKKEERYLSVLNPDCYQALEDEIAVKGEYKDVADISCNFPITTTMKDGYTHFKVKLAPAEGIMIRIQK